MAAAKKKGKSAKLDPITDRSRALNDQIAALEAEIKKLDTQIQRAPTPKLRSTAIPHGATIARSADPAPLVREPAHEPVFEEIKPKPVQPEENAPEQFNEFGVRKYDLPGLIRRMKNHFNRPTTNNPRLVTYLAAGGVHGLRPLRYEKRVARNRFIVLVIFLFIILLGTVLVYVRHH